MRRLVEPTFAVGMYVFVTGGSGRVVKVHGDGTYDVAMAWGETITARWPDMTRRI